MPIRQPDTPSDEKPSRGGSSSRDLKKSSSSRKLEKKASHRSSRSIRDDGSRRSSRSIRDDGDDSRRSSSRRSSSDRRSSHSSRGGHKDRSSRSSKEGHHKLRLNDSPTLESPRSSSGNRRSSSSGHRRSSNSRQLQSGKLRLDDNPVLESPSSSNRSPRSPVPRASSSRRSLSDCDNGSITEPASDGNDDQGDGAMIHAEVAPRYEDQIENARDRAVRDVEDAHQNMLKVQVATDESRSKRIYYIMGVVTVILAGGITAAVLLLLSSKDDNKSQTTIMGDQNNVLGDQYNILEQYFIENTVIQVFEGGVDETYTLNCATNPTGVENIGVVATNATSGIEECVDSLSFDSIRTACEVNGKVDLQLEGDYNGLVLGLGFLGKNNGLDCTSSSFAADSGSGLVVESACGENGCVTYTTAEECRQAALALGKEIGGGGFAFEGDLGTYAAGCYFYPQTDTSWPNMAFWGNGGTASQMENCDELGVRVRLNSCTPGSSPPVSVPTPSPVMAPSTSAPVAFTNRRDYLEAVLADHTPLHEQAMDWLVNVDTWMPREFAAGKEGLWKQRYALVIFTFQEDSGGWDTDLYRYCDAKETSVCDWSDVTCAGNDVRGYEHYFGGINISPMGTIPTEFGLLSRLTSLSFGTGVGGTIPSELGALGELENLVISGGQRVVGSIPTEFGKLSSLTNLLIYNSALSGTVPTEFGGMTALRTLSLYGHSNIYGRIPSEIGNIRNLRSIQLYSNELSGTVPSEVGRLTSLTSMEIHNNVLSGSLPSEIGRLTVLTKLTMTGTNNVFSQQLPSELGRLNKLTTFDLPSCDLTGTIPTEFAFLTGLRQLKLTENRLTGPLPSEIGTMSALTNLMLSDNSLSGSLPSELGQLTFTNLWLDQNQLSGSIPPLTVRSSSYNYCKLDTNQFTDGLTNIQDICTWEVNPWE